MNDGRHCNQAFLLGVRRLQLNIKMDIMIMLSLYSCSDSLVAKPDLATSEKPVLTGDIERRGAGLEFNK